MKKRTTIDFKRMKFNMTYDPWNEISSLKIEFWPICHNALKYLIFLAWSMVFRQKAENAFFAEQRSPSAGSVVLLTRPFFRKRTLSPIQRKRLPNRKATFPIDKASKTVGGKKRSFCGPKEKPFAAKRILPQIEKSASQPFMGKNSVFWKNAFSSAEHPFPWRAWMLCRPTEKRRFP